MAAAAASSSPPQEDKDDKTESLILARLGDVMGSCRRVWKAHKQMCAALVHQILLFNRASEALQQPATFYIDGPLAVTWARFVHAKNRIAWMEAAITLLERRYVEVLQPGTVFLNEHIKPLSTKLFVECVGHLANQQVNLKFNCYAITFSDVSQLERRRERYIFCRLLVIRLLKIAEELVAPLDILILLAKAKVDVARRELGPTSPHRIATEQELAGAELHRRVLTSFINSVKRMRTAYTNSSRSSAEAFFMLPPHV